MKKRRDELQALVFSRLSYDEKLEYCDRPEHVAGPSKESWKDINAHLGTSAESLVELVQELGKRQFGHSPVVGDSFCGGGSIPFEAARIGCESYGSDLNPVAALLTWAAVNIVGGTPASAVTAREAQRLVYEVTDRQIAEWGVEHNENGLRADAFLYCSETRCPECHWLVPLAPSWVIGEKTRTVATLRADAQHKRFVIEIESGVSDERMRESKLSGTAKDSALCCPNSRCGKSTPMTMIRGDRQGDAGTIYGLRMWESHDIVPRPDDVFQERLYCVRWVEKWRDGEGKEQTEKFYRAPDEEDLRREEKVLRLLCERFGTWQERGYIPSRRIEPGEKTDEPIRTRGWTHWHHLFSPRQLLGHGLCMESASALFSADPASFVPMVLWVGILGNRDSKLARWVPSFGVETTADVFSNQALNTMVNWASRGLTGYLSVFSLNGFGCGPLASSSVEPADCRSITRTATYWITDPPYADAINYHELSDFFLAWYEKELQRLFPGWYSDTKKALAVTGSDEGFRKSMVECYRNLTAHMPDAGAQIVMFTHQDAGVWADLALILWASGLRVTAAWCIATETDTTMREGNYVQGTVLLILRKQASQETAFLDEVVPQVEQEVKTQLDSMLALDDQEDPNFGDTDYQLAAYAAALRVLTKYRSIEDIDIAYELSKPQKKGEESPIERVIADAVKTACDHLVPRGFEQFVWKTLTPEERFYLKGLDLESHREFRTSAYMELARGFGVRDYKSLLSSGRANQTRLKTASEFESRMLDDSAFGRSLVRNALFATREGLRQNEAQAGRNWLKTELPGYWNHRKSLIAILRYLASMEFKIPNWKDDGHAAGLVAGTLENDSV